jgi:predicted lactoylglutathione lyase
MKTDIYINLPVKDLNKTKAFFSELGFNYNPAFTDENAACMILNEHASVMLLKESFFKTFIKKEIADAHKSTEVLLAIMLKSRNEVDEFVTKALSMEAVETREPRDYGFIYDRAFNDLDGHTWEVGYLDMSQFPKK